MLPKTSGVSFFCSIAIVLLSLLLSIQNCSANSDSLSHQCIDEGYSRLVNWMKDNGGRVNNKFGIVTENNNGIRGVQAFADIEEGAELLFCPWHLVIGSSSLQDQMQTGDGMCKVVEEMAREIRSGDDSLWCPYLDHIGSQRLPADWSGEALRELQGLSPGKREDATRHLRWFDQRCEGELDDAARRSLVAFISRASEVGMVPIYDLLNHHNGKRNAKLTLTEEGVHLMVVGGTIFSGQEIYLSYGLKTASTMYRDYGFVEEWPTAWNFVSAEGNNFAFMLFPDGVVALNPSADLLRTVWQSNMSLEEYLSLATLHTESLSSGDLEMFANAVEKEMQFPTTSEEDEISLRLLLLEHQLEGKEGKEQISASSSSTDDSDSSNNNIVEDRISALRYRIAHKKALMSAKVYCNAILKKRSLGE